VHAWGIGGGLGRREGGGGAGGGSRSVRGVSMRGWWLAGGSVCVGGGCGGVLGVGGFVGVGVGGLLLGGVACVVPTWVGWGGGAGGLGVGGGGWGGGGGVGVVGVGGLVGVGVLGGGGGGFGEGKIFVLFPRYSCFSPP